VRFSGYDCVRQIHHRSSEFFMGGTVVFCFHRSLTSRQGSFALRYASLASLHFALGNAIRGLGKARCAKEDG
jgi:hypothetical protein